MGLFRKEKVLLDKDKNIVGSVIERVEFFVDKRTGADIPVSELKNIVDFIVDNGYVITTKDFRKTSLHSGSIMHDLGLDRLEYLQSSLENIIIYKEDKIEDTYIYLLGKQLVLKELLSIKDGSIFNKYSVDLFDYIKSKQTI